MKKIIYAILMLCICVSAKAGDNKIVTLITSGQGKTQDEAKQNALRNAIEQTFGAFISSHTEVVNDNIVKDEIISVSNGNIEKYEILTEEKLSEGIFSAILSVTVSTTKLKTYCKSKGFEIEFDGETFAANFRLIEFYKKNEEKLINEIIDQLIPIIKNSYKFEINAGEPRKEVSNSNTFIVPVQIKATLSYTAYNDIIRILRTTIKSISLTNIDKEFYEKSNLDYYTIEWIDSENDVNFILRSEKTKERLINFLNSIPYLSTKFTVYNDLFSIDGESLTTINYNQDILFKLGKIKNYTKKVYYKFNSRSKSAPIGFIKLLDFEINKNNFETKYLEKNRLTKLKSNKEYYDFAVALNSAESERKGNFVIYEYQNVFTLEELEKIKKYKIEPIIEKPVIKKQINQELIINKENTQVTENKPIFKVGDLIETVGIGDDFILGTIFQVIKIENKYFYKITDSDDKLINKLFPEEKLRMGNG